jgi:Holliday junction DNA helicase RuvA
MIAFVKGIIEEYGEDYIVVDNNGIGYAISMPVAEVEKVKKLQGQVKIFTYHYVREDQMSLFGFMEKESINMFRMLLNVSGVGPKAALSILGSVSASSIILAIITGDEKTLCRAQGVGKKLAQRIILELKDKFKNYDFMSQEKVSPVETDDTIEAVVALMALGYTRQEAASAISRIDTGISLEETVKQALKLLMKGQV